MILKSDDDAALDELKYEVRINFRQFSKIIQNW